MIWILVLGVAVAQSKIARKRGIGGGWGLLGVPLVVIGWILGPSVGDALDVPAHQLSAFGFAYGIVGALLAFAIVEYLPAPNH